MINSTGKWIFTEKGLEIYDRSNELIEVINDEDTLVLFTRIFEDFNYITVSIGDTGTNNKLYSEKDKEINQIEIDYINNHCADCDVKFKKSVYELNGKSLCPKCYKKYNSDSLVNRLTMKGA